MFKSVFNKVKQAKHKVVGLMTVVSACVVMGVSAFAAEGDVATAMTTALTAVKTDTMGVMAVVAPIGIGIAGAFMVWQLGFKFFKKLAK